MVILFRNRILRRKPEILLCIKCIIEAASRKALNRTIQIVHPLQHARTTEIKDRLPLCRTVLSGKNKLGFSRSVHDHLCILIYIAIRMSCDRDRLFPAPHIRLNTFYGDWCTEYRTIENRTNRTIRAFPHFF